MVAHLDTNDRCSHYIEQVPKRRHEQWSEGNDEQPSLLSATNPPPKDHFQIYCYKRRKALVEPRFAQVELRLKLNRLQHHLKLLLPREQHRHSGIQESLENEVSHPVQKILVQSSAPKRGAISAQLHFQMSPNFHHCRYTWREPDIYNYQNW